MSEIKKPITVARQEFIESLITICNNSGLPLFVVEDVLKYLIEQVHIASIEQYKREKEEYEKALLKQIEQKMK